MKVYDTILENCRNNKKMLAVLIDPDKYTGDRLLQCIDTLNKTRPDFILTGGSFTSVPTDLTIEIIKANTDIPVILFPGNANQFCDKIDALFFLSLISGRNPEYLIGQHVIAAPAIYRSGIETIPVGYMLIESGRTTSVEYISNTKPIPADKFDIAIGTALAGQMLGSKLVYLEAGSGAQSTVPPQMVRAVKEFVSVPVIVGGGIRTASSITDMLTAGADIIVVGNTLEKNPDMMAELVNATRNFHT